MTRVAIIGAKGVVGRELLSLLDTKKFPLSNLTLFGRENSQISFQGSILPIIPLSAENITSYDIAFFCAGSLVSENCIDSFRKNTDLIIDLSSHFRMQKDVPLIVPEVNIEEAYNHSGIIASPNCIATIASLALYPLHRRYNLSRAVITTYQAASGAGYRAVEALLQETESYLKEPTSHASFFSVPYAFNLFLHNSPTDAFGFSAEERKVQKELQKILSIPNCPISPTCVRVPILRAHSISIHAEFDSDITAPGAIDVIQNSPGIQYSPMSANPQMATKQEDVFCGRIRKDPSMNGLDIWLIGDQLLKGAALNAYQIAEYMLTFPNYLSSSSDS